MNYFQEVTFSCALLQIRDLTGVPALFSYFYSLKYITIADSFVIGASGPCLVSILAFILLKEKIGIFTVFVMIITMIGVVVISRPPILTGKDSFQENTLVSLIMISDK